MSPLLFSHFTATSCLGTGLDATLAALRAQRGGLAPCRFSDVALDTYVGEVKGLDAVTLPEALAEFDCRNHRLAQMALEQDGFAARVRAASARYGAHRIGVFLGTSTAGVLQTELGYRRRDPASGALPQDFHYGGTHNPYSLPAFLRQQLGLSGPAAAVSSACSSGAKVFSSARRMLEAGLIDAAVVGGVDSLCHTTLYGFNALELLSRQPCRPYDVARNGISIGEGAVFGLLERVTGMLADDAILLAGIGESSDAHHMSTPHPQGLGARMAMAQALAGAGIAPEQVGYVNLHGTATRSNDAAEALAMAAVLPGTPCSSTKGATGHALGAAGALEAVICALALRHGLVPAGLNTTQVDPALDVNYQLANQDADLRYAMSNAFGFGGSNCSLLFARADAVSH
ncbi:beta-ketoacyl-[acyl-carrier-protein] synthase family protein [Cupriavidus taiwanensis]|uniref:beta-ketoacyl-[acyl-carrier-protein] synthase family protein n=1 Tax=Cupriavidus taiwanensis TaxID=164546 RepID=UPI000E10B4D6|nr:beta-ketoacyl-[acyl-carrier-protein] synthase family protein [Cupriavidus taiwanensis]SOY66185.1 3-OXOACYL-(ACYL-CARRIER-PROTEIN) SYNTHASE (BETA-KETOACYL-ACP SYNTHASE II) [Cupriavidus taiwanensis]SOY66190.1 3-OXOACYL-(ACYL-CARRIER-PROTEIN) SYNTHASE (BETA-KETOACYL-ACP SYNTHASE II) [Cupriavidus taiwanensis]SOY94263.1 3-OXOACYL-(ACYL-CARRIER-PROTEIN) SYNTHASE (BETA-KETOACYL-ACP SYNTHASE II) [Cupriavidus taiwanensis]SOZ70409.1 3-OXOACYL-(ACYL-CARRIER-PROTEIN) SYNTHASE (BETA-KETOACYL-ACP SYNTHASE